MAWTADAIIVPITTDLGGYTAGLDQATAGARRAGNQLTGIFRNVGRTLFNPIVLAAGAAVSAILSVRSAVRSVSAAMDEIDGVAKFSDRIGVATDSLMALRHAAESTGVASGQLDMGLQRMTRRIATAAQGSGEAVGALRELGMSAQEMAALSPDEQFLAIADAMEGITNQSDRVRLSFALFDSEGVGLVNTMRGGADAVREMMDEAEQLGATMTRIDAAKVELANTAFANVQKVIKSIWQTLAVELSPYVQAVAELFTDAAKQGQGFGDMVSNALEWVGTAIAKVSDYWELYMAVNHMVRSAQLAVATSVVKAIDWVGDSLVKVINYLTPFELEWTGAFSRMAEWTEKEMKESFLAAGQHMDNFATGRNSKAVTEFFDNARKKSQEAAEEIARNAQNTSGALDQIGDAAIKQQAKIEEALGAINKEIAQFGMKDLDIRLAEFKGLEGVTDAQVASFDAAVKALRDLNQGKEIQAAVDSWRESIKTPLEKLHDEMNRLEEWHAEGFISDDEWERARDILGEKLQDMMPDVPTDTGPRLASFIRAGSQEAYQLQAQIQSEQSRDRIPREQLRVAERQEALLESIERKLNFKTA